MKQQLSELEHRRLLDLAREYRKSGYEVVIAPTAAQLPAFIASYAPDMLAWNNTEHVIFAVKSQKTLASSPELKDMARAIHGKNGWRFELVVTNPRDKDTIKTKTEHILNHREILDRLREARMLSEQEFGVAAFVLAWSATEAVLRTLAVKERIAKGKDSFESLAKNLFAQGILEKSQYETLAEAVKTKNSIVHGYEEPDTLSKTFKSVLSITEQLLREAATI